MKIDFNKQIVDLDGDPIKIEGERILTLKIVACNALNAPFQDEQQLSGEEKARRGITAQRIYANPDTDLSVEDVAMVKKLIGKAYGPLVVAQAWEILEKQ